VDGPANASQDDRHDQLLDASLLPSQLLTAKVLRRPLEPGQYLKDGKLKYVYNFLGENEQMITSDADVPTGKCVLGVEFVKEKLQAIRNSPVPNQCVGTATLYINDQKVGEFKGMCTQLGKFALCGEGLNIGRDGGAPVTDDYPGSQPWAFAGGTIQQVAVDVTDEPYKDYQLEMAGVMSRD
jgi:hypothetical protein